MKLQQKVENYINKHKLLTNKKPIIVGVSGGADSVALLHVLIALGYNCISAHCNFHLRKDESDRDEIFVRNMSLSYSIPYFSVDFDTITYAKANHISIEMAAREQRYEWFNELASKYNAQCIAVAHHADDSIETMLMNLIRGTGIKGLKGISAKNGNIIRPLLCCTRKEIEKYIYAKKLSFVTDSSNATLNYTRNKYRNQVLPLLEQINPAARNTLYESLARFDGINKIYKDAICKIENEIIENESNCIKINIEKLKLTADASTVLYEILSKYGFSADDILSVSEHLNNESGKMFFSTNYQLLKDREYLFVRKKEKNSNDLYEIEANTAVLMEPVNLTFRLFEKPQNFTASKSNNCIHLDASKLTFPLKIRSWRQGDSFVPYGMKNRKKLSDFFIDSKVNRLNKKNIWLLTSNDEIACIIGYRTDDRYKITCDTTKVYEIKINKSTIDWHEND